VIDTLVSRQYLAAFGSRSFDPQRSVKLQYFIAYAVMGSLMPFLSVLLKQQGLDEAQIGYAMGASSLAILLTPVVVTLLADSRHDSRRLVAAVFAVSSIALAALRFVHGFWPTVVLLCLHSLAYVAMIPLQDGLNFAVQRHREAAGHPVTPYHKIRVWGTLGFILPSILLFGLLREGGVVDASLIAATAFCLLGLVNSLRLPDPRIYVAESTPHATASSQLPTAAAGRALLRRPVLVFCVGMMLSHIASSAYYGFFPLYLTEVVGVEERWIGPIFNAGVVLEIGYMLSFGWLINRLGFKRFMIVGIICMGLRMALLAAYPSAVVAVGSQAIHGMVVLAMQVAPAMYLNRQAGDQYRSSIQGLYTMAVAGTSRVAGSLIAGQLAQDSLLHLFGYAAALSLVAAALFLFAFRYDSPFTIEGEG